MLIYEHVQNANPIILGANYPHYTEDHDAFFCANFT